MANKARWNKWRNEQIKKFIPILEDQGKAIASEIKSSIGSSEPPRSGPGEPFDSETGEAAASIDFVVYRRRGGVVLRVGSSLKRMLSIEFGTDKMDARPTILPKFQNAIPRIRRALKK